MPSHQSCGALLRLTGETPSPDSHTVGASACPVVDVVGVLACFQGVGHIEDHGEINQQDGYVEQILFVNQFVDFKGKIQSAGNQGDPLGPGSGVPESVSF